MKLIPLTQGHFAQIDNEDFDKVKGFKWRAKVCKRGIYAKTGGNLYLHKVIIDIPSGLEIDHIDRNPLNNQKSNLRICTHRENCRNRTSGKIGKSNYRGVSWHKKAGKWQVCIIAPGHSMSYGGLFVNELDAAKRYDELAKLHHKEFALLNFTGSNL